MSSKLKTNTIYTILYQIVLISTPLATAPYVSRVLGADGIGQISYTQAIVVYFNLLAALGSGTYGQRLIASKGNDLSQLSKAFWEIVIIKITLATSVILIFASLITSLDPKFKLLLLIQIVDLSVNIVDIAWLYQGIENFKKTVTRQVLIKIAGVVCIFIFVRESHDTYVYLLCYSVPTLLGYAAMWPGFKKFVKYVPIHELQPFKHFKGLMALFIPYIAVLLFSYVDKVMLGAITKSTMEVGYYEQALKFITLSLGIVTSLAVVLMPRIAQYYQNDDFYGIKKNIDQAIRFATAISSLFFLILFIGGANLIPWFFGDEFTPSIPLLKILSFLILLKGINSLLGSGYLIATFQQNKYSYAIFGAAIANILFNFILIPIMAAKGAAIASVVSELLFFLLLAIYTKKIFNIKETLLNIWKYLVAAAIAGICTYWASSFLSPTFLHTFLISVSISILYAIFILLVFKDEFVLKQLFFVLNKIKNKCSLQ